MSRVFSSDRKSQTMPVMRGRYSFTQASLQQFNTLEASHTNSGSHNILFKTLSLSIHKLITQTSSNHILGGGSTEAELNHHALLEGNISTEACLIVLDTLSFFIQSFKVIRLW